MKSYVASWVSGIQRCSAYIFPALQTFLLTFLRMRDKCKIINVQLIDKHWLFARMYITSQQSCLSQINTMQTGFKAGFDSMRKSRDCSAP